MTLDIQLYQEKDFDKLAKLFIDFDNFHADLVNEESTVPEDGYEERLLEHIKSHRVLVSKVDGVVEGFVFYNTVDAKNPIYKPFKIGQIIHLYVSPEQRNKGIASLLVRVVKSILFNEKCDHITVTCYLENELANKFYEERMDLIHEKNVYIAVNNTSVVN